MPSDRDIKQLRRGLDSLRSESLAGIADAHRDMLGPLLRVIRQADRTGNDQADARALRDRLPFIFRDMDDSLVADWAARLMLQTAAISRTAAVPEAYDPADDSDTQDDSVVDLI